MSERGSRRRRARRRRACVRSALAHREENPEKVSLTGGGGGWRTVTSHESASASHVSARAAQRRRAPAMSRRWRDPCDGRRAQTRRRDGSNRVTRGARFFRRDVWRNGRRLLHAPGRGPAKAKAAKLRALVVGERLTDLVARVHHERTVLHDRLADGAIPCSSKISVSVSPAFERERAVGAHLDLVRWRDLAAGDAQPAAVEEVERAVRSTRRRRHGPARARRHLDGPGSRRRYPRPTRTNRAAAGAVSPRRACPRPPRSRSAARRRR